MDVSDPILVFAATSAAVTVGKSDLGWEGLDDVQCVTRDLVEESAYYHSPSAREVGWIFGRGGSDVNIIKHKCIDKQCEATYFSP